VVGQREAARGGGRRGHRGTRDGRRLHAELRLVLARDVPAHRIVARERARAEGTWHADSLMALPDVRAKVRLVAVEPLAERTLQLFS